MYISIFSFCFKRYPETLNPLITQVTTSRTVVCNLCRIYFNEKRESFKTVRIFSIIRLMTFVVSYCTKNAEFQSSSWLSFNCGWSSERIPGESVPLLLNLSCRLVALWFSCKLFRVWAFFVCFLIVCGRQLRCSTEFL